VKNATQASGRKLPASQQAYSAVSSVIAWAANFPTASTTFDEL
jgi:hypothetical protein